MTFSSRSFLGSLWSPPDPVLAEAGLAGELLVARIRLGVAGILLLIPMINVSFFPLDPQENGVGLSVTLAAFVLSLLVYLLIMREFNPRWLSFATSAFDVSLVSSALIV